MSTTQQARHPELLRLSDPPTIIGSRCGDCDRVAFPMDPFGCEQCGATPDRFSEVKLAARGEIHAFATVHRHHHPRPETPFTVATIVLDDGPTLKAVVVGDTEAIVGARVEGVLETWEIEGNVETVDLRFRVVS